MIETTWCGNETDFEAAYDIRYKVFVEEQGFPLEDEKDEHDTSADHVVVYDCKIPVATGRVFADGDDFVIGRICVLKEYRGQRFGDLIVRMLLRRALDKGAARINLNAQLHAMGFYEKYGFRAVGEVFMEYHVESILMNVLAENVKFPRECEG